MHTSRLLAPIAALAFAGGCSFGDVAAGRAEAGKAVDEFHARLNEDRFGEIYDGAGEEFRGATGRQHFLDLLGAIRRKLGKVTETRNAGWRVNSRNLRTYVELSQVTRFERGEGRETFVFQVQGGRATLLRYGIDSDELILR